MVSVNRIIENINAVQSNTRKSIDFGEILDYTEMTNGIHGFITDSDKEMAKCAIDLLNNHNLRNKMSEECIKFVSEEYTIEATYGKLSKFYSEL